MNREELLRRKANLEYLLDFRRDDFTELELTNYDRALRQVNAALEGRVNPDPSAKVIDLDVVEALGFCWRGMKLMAELTDLDVAYLYEGHVQVTAGEFFARVVGGKTWHVDPRYRPWELYDSALEDLARYLGYPVGKHHGALQYALAKARCL